MAKWRLTTTWWKMPSGPRPSAKELAVLRLRGSRPAQRRHLHPDRKLQAPRCGTLHLSQRRAGAPAHHDQPGSRSTDAAELEEGPSTTSAAGRLRKPPPPAIPAFRHPHRRVKGDSALPLTAAEPLAAKEKSDWPGASQGRAIACASPAREDKRSLAQPWRLAAQAAQPFRRPPAVTRNARLKCGFPFNACNSLVVMAADSMLRRADRAQAGSRRLHGQADTGGFGESVTLEA